MPDAEPRKCFWIDPAQDPTTYGGYVPSLVTENEAGHSIMKNDEARFASPYIFGTTLEDAERICEKLNQTKFGLAPEQAGEIVLSSMAASHIASNTASSDTR